MYGIKTIKPLLLVCMMLALMFSACMPEDSGGNTEALLNGALSKRLGQQSYAFQGVSEIRMAGVAVQPNRVFAGTVMDRNRLFLHASPQTNENGVLREKKANPGEPIVFTRNEYGWGTDQALNMSQEAGSFRWNPVQAMERLQSSAKQVTINKELSNNQTIVLDVETDSKQMTKQVKSQFAPSAERWIAPERLQRLKNEYGLTDRQLASMRSEMQQKISAASGKLNDMLNSLNARGLYRIWIDRQGNMPQQLREETQLNYTSAGKQVEETSVVQFRFSDT